MAEQPYPVLWAHGLDAKPWGAKSTLLAKIAKEEGFAMDATDFQGIRDPQVRVDMFMDACRDLDAPPILAGSSLGAYVSLMVSTKIKVRGLFLLAPAVILPGYGLKEIPLVTAPVAMVHGWKDELIPPESVFHYAEMTRATLSMVDSDHRLSTAHDQVCAFFRYFLNSMKD